MARAKKIFELGPSDRVKRPKKKKPITGTIVKNPVGKPTVMVPEVLAKLEMAWSIGATNQEACCYSGISVDALHDYCTKYPEYRQTIDALKQKPFLKARKTVVEDLGNVSTAQWYLEKKLKSEFGNQQKLDITSSDNSMTPITATQNVINFGDISNLSLEDLNKIEKILKKAQEDEQISD